MSTAAPPPACSLELSTETLSGWRDRVLSRQEMQRISDHLSSCDACRARLAEFGRIASLLQSEQVPPLPQETSWARLRQHINTAPVARSRSAASAAQMPYARRRSALVSISGGLAALAAVLLVAVVHLYLVSLPPPRLIQARPTPTRSSTPTASPIPTLAPTNQLVWQKVDFPADILNSTSSLTLDPDNANTAYVCLTVRKNQPITPEIWVTYNRGLAWQIAGHLPISQVGECSLVVDSTQPDILVATIASSPPGATNSFDDTYQDFASTDGGGIWQDIGTGKEYGELATYQGTTYALGNDLSNSSNPYHLDLAVSNNLRIWHNVDKDIVSFGDAVDSFWLNPTNGELLAAGQNQTVTSLWDSRDGGQNWSQLPSPMLTLNNLTMLQFVMQLPAGGQSWHLCVSQQINADPPHSYNLLACSSDGGQSWTQQTALNVTTNLTILRKSDGKLLNYAPVSQLYLIGIEADGSLLAAVDDASTATTSAPPGIYRLRPNGSEWQRIGRAPPSVAAYQSTFMSFASGVIWLGGICANLVNISQPCYSVNVGDGVYTTSYP